MSWRTLLLFGAMAACVPSEIETDPAGGADVTMVPSAATTGTPFLTPDGWTVTIHQFVIRVMAGDTTTAAGTNAYTGGGYGPWGLLTPSPNCHLRVTGAGAGETAEIDLQLTQISTGSGYIDTPVPPCGVDAATARRFEQDADEAVVEENPGELPNVLIAADAVKDGRHITISAVVSMGFGSPQKSVFVTIKANAGIPVRFPINAEMLFIPSDGSGISMDQIAAADLDGDGVVTGSEMAQNVPPCGPPTDADGGTPGSTGDDDDFQFGCPNLLADLAESTNVGLIIGPGATP